MKRVVLFILTATLLLTLMTGCLGVKKSENLIELEDIEKEVDVVSSAAPSINEVLTEDTIKEEPEAIEEVVDEVEVEIENENENENENEKTYGYIGAGYFFSEPFTETYPTVTDKGIEIRNGNSEGIYVLIAVKNEVENHIDLPVLEQDGLRFDIHNSIIELTEDEMNQLYENIIYYLYEVK